ncbi:hypothetical protein NADFUDRAFT_66975 [Nadsonia fulvescens var. elongata DSM 6958]|uniref:Protein BIG1 n=1 Tax=Nadsonia fulvescens var. elongata DSM 6958 TaxID=857566 RepID=A0A1E3PH80_9ASCO|nr:hypothetical protein NADFUDRAFT_66975 [Nadsonia fulvescens var. elongata DSM 6958]
MLPIILLGSISQLLLFPGLIQALVLPTRDEYHSYQLPIEIDSAYQDQLGVDYQYAISKTGGQINYKEILELSLTRNDNPNSPIVFKYDLSAAVTTYPHGSLLRPITCSTSDSAGKSEKTKKYDRNKISKEGLGLSEESISLKVVYDIIQKIRYIFIESAHFKRANDEKPSPSPSPTHFDSSIIKIPVFNTHIQLIAKEISESPSSSKKTELNTNSDNKKPASSSRRINSLTLDQITIEYYSPPESDRRSQYFSHKLYASIVDYCHSFLICWGLLVVVLLSWSVASVLLAYALINIFAGCKYFKRNKAYLEASDQNKKGENDHISTWACHHNQYRGDLEKDTAVEIPNLVKAE